MLPVSSIGYGLLCLVFIKAVSQGVDFRLIPGHTPLIFFVKFAATILDFVQDLWLVLFRQL
jgi:hypothetical protein